jgi:hypothetical protein
MTSSSYSLPAVVNLKTAKLVADDVLRHVSTVSHPLIRATDVQEAGVPLLQILVSAKRHADSLGKRLVVEALPGGALADLFSTYGLEPSACGASADLAPADSTQRT